MESRVEKYKKIKNEKKHKRYKFMIFTICLLFFFTSLYKVDNTLREMMCIYDKHIYGFEVENGLYRIHLLGDDYVVNKEQIGCYLDKIITQAKRMFYAINDYKQKLLNN